MRIKLVQNYMMPAPQVFPCAVIRISNYEWSGDFWQLPTLNLCFSPFTALELWEKQIHLPTFTPAMADSLYNFLNVLMPQQLLIAHRGHVRGQSVALAVAEWIGDTKTIRECVEDFGFFAHRDVLRHCRARFKLSTNELTRLYAEAGVRYVHE